MPHCVRALALVALVGLVWLLSPYAQATSGDDSASTDRTDGIICTALERSASDNDIPSDYFTRLIWQESRFNPRSVSRAGALGIAQFTRATARSRGLADPFDPDQAIAKSAEFLRDLVDQFGNFGLAAAAYNAGPQRVNDWLSGRKRLPGETRAYVRIITGYAVEDWTRTEPAESEGAIDQLPPCPELEAIAQRASRRPAHAPTDAVFRRRSGSSAIVLLHARLGHTVSHSKTPSGKRPKIKSRAERAQARRPRIHRV
jgi:hypothetical protein